MSEGVTIALITAVASVLVAVVGVVGTLGRQLLSKVRAIEEQVVNDHRNEDGSPLILRNDLDAKHGENKGIALASYRLLLTVQRDVAWLLRRQAETDDRLHDLEDTLNPKEASYGQTADPRGSESAAPDDDPQPVDTQPHGPPMGLPRYRGRRPPGDVLRPRDG